MSTSNFYAKNASKIFVILENYEDEDGKISIPDEIDFQDTCEYITDQLKENKGKFDFYKYGSYNSREELRSYPSTYLATLYALKTFGSIDTEIELHAFVRSGYYSAACLDWELRINIEGQSFDGDEISEIYGYDEYFAINNNTGMAKIQTKNAVKWIEKTSPALIEQVEKVFKSCSQSYVVTARFSNGETIYTNFE